MSAPQATSDSVSLNGRYFETTNWSAVFEAGQVHSRAALEQLCGAYWPPLYNYIRRAGYAPADAQDLTQEFFARFLQRNYMSAARRERGRFRSFLLTCLQHFLTQEWRKRHRVKRGGQCRFILWDRDAAEEQYATTETGHLTAGEIYDQRWALMLFGKALSRLRDEFVALGKGQDYQLLRPFLSHEAYETGYAAVAQELGTTPATVTVMVHRLRRRYGEIVREEVALTVTRPDDLDDELNYLVALVMR